MLTPIKKRRCKIKWLKHQTDTHNNLKIQALIRKHGAEAYGLYWICNEIISRDDGDGFVISADKEWKLYLETITGIEREKIDELIESMVSLHLIDDDNGNLSNQKLSEMADDYTSRVRRVSEHSTDNVRPEKKIVEKKTKEENKDVKEIYNLYLEKFGANENVFKLTSQRKQKIEKRLADAGKEMLARAIKNTASSDFHRGVNDRGWKANLDWIIKSYEQVEKMSEISSKSEAENEYQIKGRKVSKEEFEAYKETL